MSTDTQQDTAEHISMTVTGYPVDNGDGTTSIFVKEVPLGAVGAIVIDGDDETGDLNVALSLVEPADAIELLEVVIEVLKKTLEGGNE